MRGITMKSSDTAGPLMGSQRTGSLAGPWYISLFLGTEYVQHRTSIESLPPCFLEDNIHSEA